MLIAIIGESCTGKSTLAEKIKERLGDAEIYTGKDYLRFAKNENDAKKLFADMLKNDTDKKNVIYVIAEKPHLDLLPANAVRILVTADIDLIKERFAKRMKGILPPPVSAMLERNHGIFDNVENHFHYNGENDFNTLWEILKV